MDAFERSPHDAAQVEELAIQSLCITDLRERDILYTFPNARVILVKGAMSSPAFSSCHMKKRNGVVHSKSKLEYLCDYERCTLARQMLSLNLGDGLETLELGLQNRKGSRKIFSQLKDLPVLKKLYLSSPHVRIDEIEDIHRNVPSIQDFSLAHGAHLDGRMLSNVVPATCITTFEFTPRLHMTAENCVQMYQYVTKKYPNISKMEYYDSGLNNYQISERRHIYLNGILDFLKMIGPTQNRLFLQALPDNVNAFEALDTSGSQIEGLLLFDCKCQIMFEHLCQSKQSITIKRLDFEDTIVKNFQPLKDMPALTALHIGYGEIYDQRIDLSDYLRACPPTLKNLTILNGDVFVLPFNQQLKSIEYLRLDRVDINVNMGNIISNCLPNLIDLDLSGTLVCDVNITLKSPHLQRAHFDIGDMDGYLDTRYGFVFKYPTMTVLQYYSCCFDEAIQVERGDIIGLPLLLVESITVKKSKGGDGICIH